jgi:hypothetical protein
VAPTNKAASAIAATITEMMPNLIAFGLFVGFNNFEIPPQIF